MKTKNKKPTSINPESVLTLLMFVSVYPLIFKQNMEIKIESAHLKHQLKTQGM